MISTRPARGDRFAVFWGGGLGDLLTLRPLLQALEPVLDQPPDFFTTASHLDGLFRALHLRATLHVLPKAPRAALGSIRAVEPRFDWLYLGPYPRFKTRLLGRVVGAKQLWSERHRDTPLFVGEQVLKDARLMAPETSAGLEPYGGAWPGGLSPSPGLDRSSYLLFHAGAKEGWETTRWPDARWKALAEAVVGSTGLDILFVGVPSERPRLEGLASGFKESVQRRIRLRTDLSLAGLAAAIAGSTGVVCHNSGVLHLAAMLGSPTVALTGSSARFWRPPYAHVMNLTSGRCELACNQYRCPVPFYRARCIRELEVETVMAAVRTHLLFA